MTPTIENLHPSPHPEPRTLTVSLSLKKEKVSPPWQPGLLGGDVQVFGKNSCLYSQIVAWIPRSGKAIIIYHRPSQNTDCSGLNTILSKITLRQIQLMVQSSLQGWYSLRICYNRISWGQTIILAIGQPKSKCRENKLPTSGAPQFC